MVNDRAVDVLLRGGRVIDASRGAADADRAVDVLVSGGRIAKIGKGLAAPAGARTVDVGGKLVVPGLVDLHVHLREPGHEYKEDVASGSRAAAAGGFTTVCAMPNTSPTNDTRAVTELILRRAAEVGLARVRPVGAISQGLEGERLAEMGELRDAGCVAVSDDGRPVMSAGLMRRALEYAKTFGLTVVQHAEDLTLSAGGVMHEGAASTRLGLRGQPGIAESVMVARDLELVEHTRARYHVAHLSTARSAALVRDAKQRGLPVTAEATPHHLTLTDDACGTYLTSCKCAPPLRAEADRAALCEALADGTIDAIATDHAPHSPVEKDVEFDHAAFGMIGLETAVPLVLKLVRDKVIPLARAIQLLTIGPARCFGLADGVGTLAEGAPADVCVIDLERAYKVAPEGLMSKSKNSPFLGKGFTGRAVLTLLGGAVTHDLDKVLA